MNLIKKLKLKIEIYFLEKKLAKYSKEGKFDGITSQTAKIKTKKEKLK